MVAPSDALISHISAIKVRRIDFWASVMTFKELLLFIKLWREERNEIRLNVLCWERNDEKLKHELELEIQH